jgi:hypothetical protein
VEKEILVRILPSSTHGAPGQSACNGNLDEPVVIFVLFFIFFSSPFFFV